MAAKIKAQLKLRGVVSVDFRYGVLHHYMELHKAGKIDQVRPDECILLISHTGRRMAFVFKHANIETRGGEETMVVTAYQLSLEKMTSWNPLMLSVYAERVGIELIGIKRFEDHIRHVAEERAAERKAS